ncbi:MAG: tetratricopeptide repeat protein [Acidobacteria bacterium]|nr:tetratricopeptide repeat protein [Acidobacteriota bacterium]
MLGVLPSLLLAWMQTAPAALPHLRACSESLQRNDAQGAVKSCKLAVGLDSQSAAAHFLLGQAYLAMRSASMVAEAKAEFQQALDIDDTLIWARFYLSKVYLDIGRPDKAKQELEQALKTRPGVPHFLSLLGEAERKLGAPEAAIELHKKALAADQTMNTAHYYLALALIDLKREEEAITELEASLRSPYVSPDLYLTLGSLYAQRQRFREAEDLCRKAIALDPGHSESYLHLAQVFNAQRQSGKALAALRQALPEGKTFASSPYYQKLQADTHFEFGRAYAAQGAAGDAVRAFERCLAIDSGRAEARRQLAALYRKLGDTARADEQAELAAKLDAQK